MGILVKNLLQTKLKVDQGCGSVAEHVATMCTAVGSVPHATKRQQVIVKILLGVRFVLSITAVLETEPLDL